MRTPTEAELFGRLFVLSQHLNRQADAALQTLGITSKQWLLLAVLVRAFPGDAPTLTQAAHVYGTSRQNVKQVARQLAAHGFVELRSDPRDRRTTRIALAPRAAELDEPDAVTEQSAFLTQTFAGLTDDELGTLNGLIGRCLTPLTELTQETS